MWDSEILDMHTQHTLLRRSIYTWEDACNNTVYLSFTLQAMDLLKKFLYSNKVAFSEKRFESNESIAGLREPIVSYHHQ